MQFFVILVLKLSANIINMDVQQKNWLSFEGLDLDDDPMFSPSFSWTQSSL